MIHGSCAFSCSDDALFMYVCNTHDMHTFFGTQTAKISLNGRFTKNDSIKQDPRACVWEHHIVVTNFNNEKPILVITQQAPHQQAHYLHHFLTMPVCRLTLALCQNLAALAYLVDELPYLQALLWASTWTSVQDFFLALGTCFGAGFGTCFAAEATTGVSRYS